MTGTTCGPLRMFARRRRIAPTAGRALSVYAAVVPLVMVVVFVLAEFLIGHD